MNGLKKIKYSHVCILLIAGIFMYCMGQYYHLREKIRAHSCESSRKILEQAVKQYAADHSGNLPVSDQSQVDIEMLIEQGYLKREILCPEGGKYFYNEKKVRCTYHQ